MFMRGVEPSLFVKELETLVFIRGLELSGQEQSVFVRNLGLYVCEGIGTILNCLCLSEDGKDLFLPECVNYLCFSEADNHLCSSNIEIIFIYLKGRTICIC